jgi:MYXO-CTERM domain-containing protein
MANADTVFDINGTVGDIDGTSTPSDFGYTGLTATGTITINTSTGAVDGIDLTVETDPNQFINVLACGSNCTYVATNPFVEYGLLDLGTSLTGYTGGALASDSWIYLDNPSGIYGGLGLGQGGSGVEYYLSGDLSIASAAAPEPRYSVALLGLAMLGSFLVVRRRRQA